MKSNEWRGARGLSRGLLALFVAVPTSLVAVSCGSPVRPSLAYEADQPEASTPDATATGSGDASNGGHSDGSGWFGYDGGPQGCVPKTCSDLGYTCGKSGDGCGGAIDCGTCTSPQYCGGGGYSKCGGSNGMEPDGAPIATCTPATCQGLHIDCGQTGDGCGGLLHCGTCSNPQYCGGGGFNQCGGNNGLLPDGGAPCTPTTCAALGYNCGVAADGCGGVLSCGTCTNPEYCGGGGFNQCGGNNGLATDGGVTCTPTTCAALGYTCARLHLRLRGRRLRRHPRLRHVHQSAVLRRRRLQQVRRQQRPYARRRRRLHADHLRRARLHLRLRGRRLRRHPRLRHVHQSAVLRRRRLRQVRREQRPHARRRRRVHAANVPEPRLHLRRRR
jgi:hypothetical protein